MQVEQEKITQMFDCIAGSYDLSNRVLSLGQDQRWRKLLALSLPQKPDLKVLDIATGTADLLICMCREREINEAIGVDLAENMLEIGRQKISNLTGKYTSNNSLSKLNSIKNIKLHTADACELPFESNYFDIISIAFGIRNITDIQLALREIKRVLKPGGQLLILEFSLPTNIFIKSIYLFYFRYILPILGGLISGNSNAYRYLNRTVENFPYGSDFCQLLTNAGFMQVSFKPLSLGVANFYQARCQP